MPVRIPRAGRVVPHRHRLGHLHRHLHLPAARPDPGGGVLAEPADDLGGSPVLRRVVRRGDLRVQRRRQRPRLRAVDHHLDEPYGPVIGPQPAPRLAGVRIETGDPRLVAVTGQRRQLLHPPNGGGVAAGDARPLGQVVVIGPAPVGLHVMPRRRRRTGVHLHPAAQFSTPPNNDQHVTP